MSDAADPAMPSVAAEWDAVYRDDRGPWDLGRAQSAFARLLDVGEIRPPVLDSGCGTGEHTIMLAARGLEVLGVDVSPVAVERARAKADQRGVAAVFAVADVLDLSAVRRRFRTVLDMGVFHVFDDADRPRYVESLAAVVEPGGVVHLMCFSEHTPGTTGPRRVTQQELREAFRDGWHVDRIEAAEIEVRADLDFAPPKAWLARIVRTG